ncbi:hypothetical protein SADUNF_Sadunf13G0004500 [Salix dunnii]|uniref:Uncharacterized protein n=1 Tax=Salix dunnii TaxID=1413687 RepID=A0A835JHJ6_9ROSI|nr:hypothetical protein SADUNF_Sadunf13G0004500 [Salix dunnii]
MERETKKRKMDSIEEEQETEKEDEDGEKMEKFFALLRQRKEMQDYIRRNSNGTFKEREEIKKVGEERVIVDWNPSFQPEDFSEYGKDISHEPAGPSSKRKHGEKKDKGEEGTDLDLNLSL